jgi:glutathione S-transferase
VPSLEHDNEVRGESLDLIKYIDSNFDGPALLPEVPTTFRLQCSGTLATLQRFLVVSEQTEDVYDCMSWFPTGCCKEAVC